MRLALLLEYDGTGFRGSQYQSFHGHELPTVQGTLKAALNTLQVFHSGLTFAGRTDSGVHARGQVVHCTVADGVKLPRCLRTALNAVLPSTIRVQQVALDIDPRFHAQLKAQWRWYRYQIFNAPVQSVWAEKASTLIRTPLDLAKMDAETPALIGKHGFRAFQCPNTLVSNDVCRVVQAKWHQNGPTLVLDIVADRFLYKMVRNLVGELIQVGQGKAPVSHMARLLAERQRPDTAYTAPPGGLTLMAIHYPEPWQWFQSDTSVATLHTFIHSLEESYTHENVLCKAS